MVQKHDDELTSQIAAAVAAGLPLHEGLLAAAEEYPAGETSRQLRSLAAQLKSGKAPVEVLAAGKGLLPNFVVAALQAGLATHNLEGVLLGLTDYESQRREIREHLRASMSYPLIVLAVMSAVVAFSFLWLLPATISLLSGEEFGNEGNVETARWLSESGTRYAGLSLAFVAGVLLLLRFSLGRARWRWFSYSFPILGAAFAWQGAWEFASKLQMLTAGQIPLGQALRIVADNLRDANFADVAKRLAEGEQAGLSLFEQLKESSRIPATLTALVGWGESQGQLDTALRLASQSFAERLRIRVNFMTSVFPAVLYALVACVAVLAASMVVSPLLVMIQWLSGGWVGAPANSISLLGLGWIGLIVPGIVLWWIIHLLFSTERFPPDAFLIFGLRLTAAIMVLLGCAGTLAGASLPIAIPLVIGLLIVWGMVATRFRQAEAQQLIALLELTRECGLPLIPAVRAFAVERTDEIGVRAMQLVDRLEQGASYEAALAHARLPLSIEATLAARTEISNRRPAAVSRNQICTSLPPAGVGLLQRLMYITFLPAFGLAVWTFLAVRIIPTFQQIFDDFELELPRPTQWAITISERALGSSLASALLMNFLVAVLTLSALMMIVLIFYYVGWLRWEPPFIRRWTSRYHGALVMRSLARTVDAGATSPNSWTSLRHFTRPATSGGGWHPSPKPRRRDSPGSTPWPTSVWSAPRPRPFSIRPNEPATCRGPSASRRNQPFAGCRFA